MLTFVQEHGKIKLALRSLDDAKTEEVKPADWDTLLRYLDPNAKKESKEESTVEIYRGLHKETVPLRSR